MLQKMSTTKIKHLYGHSCISNPQKKVTTKKKLKLHFKINDYVRISHKSMLFDRSYNEHFTQEMVKVCQRFRMQGICMYTLKDFLNEDIKGHFYASELQKVNKNEDSLWFIEKIIRKRKTGGEVQLFVKFEGWPNKYNQWISEKNLKHKHHLQG